MTIENHSYAQYCFFFLYLIKPRFYYISAGLMKSASHGDVSMMTNPPTSSILLCDVEYMYCDVSTEQIYNNALYRVCSHIKHFDQTVSSDATATSALFKKMCLASRHLNVYRTKLASLIAKVLKTRKTQTKVENFVYKRSQCKR